MEATAEQLSTEEEIYKVRNAFKFTKDLVEKGRDGVMFGYEDENGAFYVLNPNWFVGKGNPRYLKISGKAFTRALVEEVGGTTAGKFTYNGEAVATLGGTTSLADYVFSTPKIDAMRSEIPTLVYECPVADLKDGSKINLHADGGEQGLQRVYLQRGKN